MGKALFLIVDDDPQIPQLLLRMISCYFKECGREVELTTHARGEAAIDFVDQALVSHPGAQWGLITDHDMPGMNGLQLLEALDGKLGDKLLTRVVMTGILTPERKAKIDAAGAFAESKPFDTASIKAHLQSFLVSLS